MANLLTVHKVVDDDAKKPIRIAALHQELRVVGRNNLCPETEPKNIKMSMPNPGNDGASKWHFLMAGIS